MAVVFRLLSCQRLTYKVFFELHFDFRLSPQMVNALACVDRVHGQTLEQGYPNITEIFIDCLLDTWLLVVLRRLFRHSSRCCQTVPRYHRVAGGMEYLPNQCRMAIANNVRGVVQGT
jgi:hypothetical protein